MAASATQTQEKMESPLPTSPATRLENSPPDGGEIHLVEVGDVAIAEADKKYHGIQCQHNSGCKSQHHDGYHLAARPLFKIQLSHSLLQLLHGFDILASLRSKKKIA